MKYDVCFKNIKNGKGLFYSVDTVREAENLAERWLEVNPHTEARIFNAETGIEIYRKQN